MPYAIQVLTNAHGWTISPQYLGNYSEADNQWDTESEALAALEEMVAIGGFTRDKLRVTEID